VWEGDGSNLEAFAVREQRQQSDWCGLTEFFWGRTVGERCFGRRREKRWEREARGAQGEFNAVTLRNNGHWMQSERVILGEKEKTAGQSHGSMDSLRSAARKIREKREYHHLKKQSILLVQEKILGGKGRSKCDLEEETCQ